MARGSRALIRPAPTCFTIRSTGSWRSLCPVATNTRFSKGLSPTIREFPCAISKQATLSMTTSLVNHQEMGVNSRGEES